MIKKIALFDWLFSPITFIASTYLKSIRRLGIERMPIAHKIFDDVGIFPIRDYYYEPLFNSNYLKKSLRNDRELPGIDFNREEQLDLLKKFNYNSELLLFPLESHQQNSKLEFYYNNQSFMSGDAEFLYNIIRYFQPQKIIEIGSGMSTLMTLNAIRRNEMENSDYNCEIICIEPYGASWLKDTDVKLKRTLVENLDKSIFSQLSKNDILFIDSSHIIRPQGDVLFEYLEVLPILKEGVIVHIHDIFTPKDYLNEWIIDQVLFWNEQYLLEAFMSHNSDYKIIAALNFLTHHYPDEISSCCPVLKNQISYREPGSFWLIRK